jgi:hypothetical protein
MIFLLSFVLLTGLSSRGEVAPEQVQALGHGRLGVLVALELQRDPAPIAVPAQDRGDPAVVEVQRVPPPPPK